MLMRIIDAFDARGHINVMAAHPTTIEVTREETITPRGDCIVAVASSKGAKNLSEDFKRLARRPEARIMLTLEVDDLPFSVTGRGSPSLTFLSSRDMVVRKSGFISDRTIMISANKAAIDIPKLIVERLRNPDARVSVILEVEV
jgi:uncharacterized protein